MIMLTAGPRAEGWHQGDGDTGGDRDGGARGLDGARGGSVTRSSSFSGESITAGLWDTAGRASQVLPEESLGRSGYYLWEHTDTNRRQRWLPEPSRTVSSPSAFAQTRNKALL